MAVLAGLLTMAFADGPVTIRFMTEGFGSEWPDRILHPDDHYGFNIEIRDRGSVGAGGRAVFTIASRYGKDTETVAAPRFSDSSYRARVFLEGSVNKGVLRVNWVDTIVCAYKGASDTVAIGHVLRLAPRPRAIKADADEDVFLADGRKAAGRAASERSIQKPRFGREARFGEP